MWTPFFLQYLIYILHIGLYTYLSSILSILSSIHSIRNIYITLTRLSSLYSSLAFPFVFLTHLCGSISGNTCFRYLLDSSPMQRKIVFFFIIWTINTVSIETLSKTVVTRLAVRLSNHFIIIGVAVDNIDRYVIRVHQFQVFFTSVIISIYLTIFSIINFYYLLILFLLLPSVFIIISYDCIL